MTEIRHLQNSKILKLFLIKLKVMDRSTDIGPLRGNAV
jgi:hypothetical protein